MYLELVKRLPGPARYTPWQRGVYEVAPALRPFGTDFGNGSADQSLFQLDTDRDRFRRNKRDALLERHAKYVQKSNLSAEVEREACVQIATRLSTEYPDRFQLLETDRGQELAGEGGRVNLTPGYAVAGVAAMPAIERLSLVVEEDVAVVSYADSHDWVSFLHLCAPSHWRAEDKIGRSFFNVHKPIPGFEKINAVATPLVDSMLNRGPFVRFVWGIESDYRLNHHPDPPPGWDQADWQGRDFSHGFFWVRTERQVIWGLPSVAAALFTIKVGFHRSDEVLADPALRDPLVSALESMTEDARAYKGLARDWKTLLKIVKS